MPDVGAYTPWYPDTDVVNLPGVHALTSCIDRVRAELQSIRSTRTDYAAGAQGGVTAAAAAAAQGDGNEGAGHGAPHQGGDGAWMVSGFQRFSTINQAMIDACPVTWECLQQFPIQDSWGEVGFKLAMSMGLAFTVIASISVGRLSHTSHTPTSTRYLVNSCKIALDEGSHIIIAVHVPCMIVQSPYPSGTCVDTGAVQLAARAHWREWTQPDLSLRD